MTVSTVTLGTFAIALMMLLLLFWTSPLSISYNFRIVRTRYLTGDNWDESVLTAKGYITYKQLEDLVFRPFGYEIVKTTIPIPKLRHIKRPTCEKVFTDWLAVAKTYNESLAPPKTIPDILKNTFLMSGFSGQETSYYDNRSAKSGAVWSAKDIEKRIRNPIPSYPGQGEAVFYATRYYNVSGMTGLVIGSLDPWAEAYCLRNKAARVITVEYKKIETDHPKLSYHHPIEMARNFALYEGKFDFAVSFSSLEHSGLGRYGDPIDPIGDLREAQKVCELRRRYWQVWCQLKPDGLFFLGLPTGLDRVVYNAHRVYGRIRLAMMAAGFDHLDTFYGRTEAPTALNIEKLYSTTYPTHFLLVLRKSL